MNTITDGSGGEHKDAAASARPSSARERWKALLPAAAVLLVALMYIASLIKYVNCTNGNVCHPADVKTILTDNHLCYTSFDGWYGAEKEAKEKEAKERESAPAQKAPVTSAEKMAAAPKPTASPTPAPAPPHVPTESEYAARLFPARLWWLHVTSLNLMAFPLALLIGSYLILKSLVPKRRLKVLLPVLTLGAAVALLNLHLLSLKPPPVVEMLYCTVVADVSDAIFLTKLPVGLAYATIVVLVCASCVIAWPTKDDLEATEAIEELPEGARHDAAARLASRMNDLRVLLYVGTAALVAAVLRMNATTHWAASFLPSGDSGHAWAAKLIDDISTATASAEAGTYTILLASIYLPPMLVLRARARRLAKTKCVEDGRERPCTREEREKWLKDEGLIVSFSEYLPRVVAILGPLLAGPLGDLLGRIAGK